MSGACYKIFCTVSAGVCVWSFFALFPAASILHHPSIIPQSLFHPQDALPSMADLYPPSKPIFSFYPRGTDRTRTFPRGREVDYFNKQYSDGFLPPPPCPPPPFSPVFTPDKHNASVDFSLTEMSEFPAFYSLLSTNSPTSHVLLKHTPFYPPSSRPLSLPLRAPYFSSFGRYVVEGEARSTEEQRERERLSDPDRFFT